MNGLILHRGGVVATAEQVSEVKTPQATETWCPVAHTDLILLVEREMTLKGLEIADRGFGLSENGLRMFGVLSLRSVAGDYTTTIGIRNSHDKSFPAAIALGSRVFVCDNLAFSAEVVLARKHTVHIWRDLPGLVSTGVAKLVEAQVHQAARIEAYKGHNLSDSEAHDIVIRALDRQVAPITKVPAILEQWRKPVHDAFQPRTVWSLFNGFTEVLKGNFAELPRRTTALHGLCDQVVGLLEAPAAQIEAVAA